MAKAPAKADDAEKGNDGNGAKSEAAEEKPQQETRQITVDESNLVKSYANFCRVTPGFEELIIDFGLSPQPIGAQQPQQNVALDQRVIVNYYMGKRLLALLQGAVQRYESIFGVLETDIQKRVQPRNQ